MPPFDDDSSEYTTLAGSAEPLVVNEVHLVGHMSKPLEIKEMPSGDWLGKWALVVKRPRRDGPAEVAGSDDSTEGGSAGSRRRQSHDTIDCISFDMELIERLSDVVPRTRLEVRGALRRWFRRGQPGQSSYEVEAFTVAVLSTPQVVDSATPTEDAAPADNAAPVERSDLAERSASVTAAGSASLSPAWG